MMARLIFKPQARRDALDVAYFIAKDNLEAAGRFITALETTAHALAEMPEIGRRYGFKHRHLQGVRFLRVSKVFSAYLIFYHIIPHGIEVIRVLHGSRDFPLLFGET